MREIFDSAAEWNQAGGRMALATVTATWGSSPRPVGSQMVVNQKGEMAGSVSGGCVEGAVVDSALQVLEADQPRLLQFGVTDQTAWDVGLACGGEIEILVKPLKPEIIQTWKEILGSSLDACSVCVVSGPEELLGQELILDEDGRIRWGSALDDGLIEKMRDLGRKGIETGSAHSTLLDLPGDAEQALKLLVNPEVAPYTLIAVGGVHIAIPLMSLAEILGYRTVVIDPRKLFASRERFPKVDEFYPVWPQQAFQELKISSRTAIALLTHDPKIDDPALMAALNSDAFYIGALGSSRTQAKRRRRMLEAGFDEAQLERIHGPIGLDLGGRSAGEIALAIMAEMVKVRYQKE